MASLLWGYGCRCLPSILVSISRNKDETLSYSTIWISTDKRQAYKGLFEGSGFIDPYLSKVVYVYVLALSCICVFILSSSNFGRRPTTLETCLSSLFLYHHHSLLFACTGLSIHHTLHSSINPGSLRSWKAVILVRRSVVSAGLEIAEHLSSDLGLRPSRNGSDIIARITAKGNVRKK